MTKPFSAQRWLLIIGIAALLAFATRAFSNFDSKPDTGTVKPISNYIGRSGAL